MDWRKGFKAKYYLSFVDPNTWRDLRLFEIIGGSINLELSGLRNSADIDCRDYDETTEKLVRVWLDCDQPGSTSSHTPLFTGYAAYPDRKNQGNIMSTSLQCYSVLLPASNVYLARGWYAPVEISAETLIRTLLIPTKATIEFHEMKNQNGGLLTRSVIAESGETNLSMVEKLLAIMNWRMWIDGMGVIHIAEYDSHPVATFDSIINDIIEPNITVSYDWFDCPNVIRVIMDEQSAEAYDYDSDTPMSINNRGREVWYEEENVDLNKGENLQEYANRRLKELQRVSTSISYDRRFYPTVNGEDRGIYPTDVVRLNYPNQNIEGLYMITSQTITLGFNAKTSEEVIKV